MRRIVINLAAQSLRLEEDGSAIREYAVSTAANGAGEKINSFQTPRGLHRIHAKIGEGLPPNTVLRGRQPTGEIYSTQLARQMPQRDWILTRILWLEGCEPRKNLGGDVDTKQRYIYIHGAPDDVAMGKPGSLGCIRMTNTDIRELFDLTDMDMSVLIVEAE